MFKIIFLSLLFLFLPVVILAAVGDIVKSFPTPEHYCTGLTCDGKHLWVVDRKTDLIYKIDMTDGHVLATIPAPGYSPTGLAWDGSHLWCIDDKESLIYRIDIKTGIAERIIEAYTKNMKDICWDGVHLWVADDKLDLIMSIDAEDGMMISSIPAPAKNPDGLAFDGKYLWISDRTNDMIYRIEPVSGMVIGMIHAPGHYARGLAWDGKSLWNVDYESDKIYQLNVTDAQFLIQSNSKQQKLENYFDFRNYGPGTVTELDVYIAIPENRDNQQLLGPASFEPVPDEIIMDQWGQQVAHFKITNLKSGACFRTIMTVKAKIMAIEYFIDPQKAGTLQDIPQEIKSKYLVDGKKLLLNDPLIQETAHNVVGNEQNPYWIARKIFNYLIGHLSYNLKPVGGWNTAPTVLQRGTASCSEYSFSFIALCRAVGVPVRYVGAVSLRGDDASLDEVFHRWCEVYLPNYGWIPFDANKGDEELPADQATGIGNIACRYLITTTSGGDSKYLDWTYNFNYQWKSTDKCRVYSEQYGEWSPLEE